VNFTLANIAYTNHDPKIARRGRLLNNRHFARGSAGHLRGSDQTEKIAVCVMAMMASGWSENDACVDVASNPNVRLGQSRRGRPTNKIGARDLASKTQTVRSIVNKAKSEDVAKLVHAAVEQFRWLRQEGIVVGAQFVENSGRRMQEVWEHSLLKRCVQPRG